MSLPSNVFYLFTITKQNNTPLLFCNAEQDIVVDKQNLRYSSHSDIDVTEIVLDSKGENSAILEGIFSMEGIRTELTLLNAYIQIDMYNAEAETISSVGKYYCVKVESSFLRFKIFLQSELHKLKKHALIYLFQDCQASLGDQNCTVNMKLFEKSYRIVSIKGSVITIQVPIQTNLEVGYYSRGYATIDKNDVLILQHTSMGEKDGTRLDKVVVGTSFWKAYAESILERKEEIKLKPGCDKTIEMCKGRFNNEHNFCKTRIH
ncbi:baseplate hub domain-containing protein [Candidatus Sneabacter namystus]|uniref:DUF2163 domain-containing protein n=1 Tax=Candidatus Sneabacter namystus TaxID=2601646 RepID=A0A5C0UJG9_9RICK|nr:phage BR0599 family protein [Candidatus Sneabacter namystus]QEK39751.1 DUF2163 domain-containing protein [Candidatus Sneabacter namystus]